MPKLSELIGLPVLEMKTGTQIGEVLEVVVNVEQAALYGIIVAGSSWFTQDRGVLVSELASMGQDAVMLHNSEDIGELSIPADQTAFKKFSEMVDKAVYTESGSYLGMLVDVVYSAGTGEVRFYELSEGLITDFLRGRTIMPLPPAQVISPEKIIVPESMGKLLHTTNQESGGV